MAKSVPSVSLRTACASSGHDLRVMQAARKELLPCRWLLLGQTPPPSVPLPFHLCLKMFRNLLFVSLNQGPLTFSPPRATFTKVKMDASYSYFGTFILMLYFDTLKRLDLPEGSQNIGVHSTHLESRKSQTINPLNVSFFLFLYTVVFAAYFTLLD